MDQDNTTWTVARTPGVIRETVCMVVHQRTASLDSDRGLDVTGSEVHEGRTQTGRREWNTQSTGRPRLICRPSSRTGENPLSGMIGGTMETSASFEAWSSTLKFRAHIISRSESEKLKLYTRVVR